MHLALNHMPLAVTFLGLAMLTYGIINRHGIYIRLGFIFFVVAAGFTILAFGTGIASHDVAESLPGVSHDQVKPHRDAAKMAMMVMMALAGLMALGHYVLGSKNAPPPWFMYFSFVLGAISLLLLMNAGFMGGQIRHPELRPNFNVGGQGMFLEGLQGYPPGYTEEDIALDKQKRLEFLKKEKEKAEKEGKGEMDHSQHQHEDHSQHQH